MQYQKPVIARTKAEAAPCDLRKTIEENIDEIIAQYRNKLYAHYAVEHRDYHHTPLKIEIMVRISLPLKHNSI